MTHSSLADLVVGAVVEAAETPLLQAGFAPGGDGWFKRVGELYQVVRLVAPRKSRLVWTSLGVALEIVWARDHEDRFGLGSLPATPLELRAQRFAEARLWDLIPDRPRGGAWTVTRESVLGVVGADVAAALVQYGLPYLDEMTSDVRQMPEVMRRYQAKGLYSPLVDWRERKARVLWLIGEREAAQALLGGQ